MIFQKISICLEALEDIDENFESHFSRKTRPEIEWRPLRPDLLTFSSEYAGPTHFLFKMQNFFFPGLFSLLLGFHLGYRYFNSNCHNSGNNLIFKWLNA